MKKIILSILTIVYLFAASGFSIEQHYCMGKLAGVDLFGTKQDKCPKCGMKEKKTGCCHDEHQFLKLKDTHKITTNEITYKGINKIVISTYNTFTITALLTSKANLEQIDFSPPNIFRPPTYILNCNFRI